MFDLLAPDKRLTGDDHFAFDQIAFDELQLPTPSVRPTLIRRRSGLPSWPITQTIRV